MGKKVFFLFPLGELGGGRASLTEIFPLKAYNDFVLRTSRKCSLRY